MQCSRLTQVDFDQLTQGAQVLEADSHGAKVYLLADGNFLKVLKGQGVFTTIA